MTSFHRKMGNFTEVITRINTELEKPSTNQLTIFSEETKKQLKEVTNETQSSYYDDLSTKGLLKPRIPSGEGFQHYEICFLICEKIWRIIVIRNLFSFYTQDSLQKTVNIACKHDYVRLMKIFCIPTLDMTCDFAVLALFDITLVLDDSGSMTIVEYADDGLSRFMTLQQVVKTISSLLTMFDSDGITLSWINSKNEGNNIKSSSQVENLFRSVMPYGGTAIGKKLKEIFSKHLCGKLLKPVLIITVTDGAPDSETDVTKSVKMIKNHFSKSEYGENAVCFSFVQIGSDKELLNFWTN